MRARERTRGRPPSANGASSLHLWWGWRGVPPELVEVGVTLTVVEPPRPDRLHFWALQATFADRAGRRHGGGHTGLQVHPGVPGRTAVNWGGYDPDGRELAGTESALPSALRNPNTRDLAWRPGEPVRLSIHRGAEGWAASVDDVPIRELHAGGDRLVDVVVWSEVFADCDAPASGVVWSDPSGTTPQGQLVRPLCAVARYQDEAAGGCSNTTSEPDGRGGLVQRTNTHRTTPAGMILPWG